MGDAHEGQYAGTNGAGDFVVDADTCLRNTLNDNSHGRQATTLPDTDAYWSALHA